MRNLTILFSIFKADFFERTRRSSFLLTLCLVIYLGYAVNTGQILIKLGDYRGIYNSAWVGSLMALVITFFLGIIGFFLVKNCITRDEQTGVGQIIATTSITRPQYLIGKWLSNFAVLTALVGLLAFAAVFMQIASTEGVQVQIWDLLAPILFIAVPMMALVAAFAIFFETIPWLKGGFGNLVYFALFTGILIAGVQLSQAPWIDVIGLNLVGSNMRAAAKAAFPAYDGSFTLAMISGKPLHTFIWSGLNWTGDLILLRLSWFIVALVVVLCGSLFFNRFDSSVRSAPKPKKKPAEGITPQEVSLSQPVDMKAVRLMPLAENRPFHNNFFRLVWVEGLLLVKGQKWYWLAGAAAIWIGCVLSPGEGYRKFWYMLAALWPILVLSNMGVREARYKTGELIFQGASPLARILGSSWLAGIFVTAVMTSGVLLGRLISGEAPALQPWGLAVIFIPTLALTLGVWSRSNKLFEVVYFILWYLGPFNPQNGLVILDYLGIHAQAPVNTSPLSMIGFIFVMLCIAWAGRKRQMQ